MGGIAHSVKGAVQQIFAVRLSVATRQLQELAAAGDSADARAALLVWDEEVEKLLGAFGRTHEAWPPATSHDLLAPPALLPPSSTSCTHNMRATSSCILVGALRRAHLRRGAGAGAGARDGAHLLVVAIAGRADDARELVGGSGGVAAV